MKNCKLDCFGPVLRRFRESKNLSQDRLGEIAGVSGAFISMLESSLRYPNLDMTFRLAEALGLPMPVLIH